MGNVIKGWKPASRFSGIAVRTLRKGVEDGALCGTKKDGIWSFVHSDLLAFAAAIGKAVPTAPTTVVNATTATPSASAPSASGPPAAACAVTSSWLLAASSAHADCGGEDENEDDVETHQPPFWMSGTGPAPSYQTGIPVIDPITYRVFYTPEPVTKNHAPGSSGAVVQQLQAQVAGLQAQLAATITAWRHQRVAAIAAEIAVEALLSGTLPQIAAAARDAAHAAAAALTDDELRREDGYPQAVARGAAMGVAQQAGMSIAWAQAQAPWPSLPPREPFDDLSRARARRRSRSPRW